MIKENCNSCKDCPTRWANFDCLNEEELIKLNNSRFEARFKAGETIFKQGSPTSNAIFIIEGLAKVYIEGYDAKNIILSIVQPKQLIAGPGTYVDNRHHYSLSALTDTIACFVDMNLFKELTKSNSIFAEGLIKDISIKALSNFEKLINFSQKKMHGRLAEGIIYLSTNIFNSTEFNCILNRKELGEFTGMTKESVVRLLKEFNDEGIIQMNQNHMKIIDMDRLNKIMISG